MRRQPAVTFQGQQGPPGVEGNIDLQWIQVRNSCWKHLEKRKGEAFQHAIFNVIWDVLLGKNGLYNIYRYR